jgi:hypothetical protein
MDPAQNERFVIALESLATSLGRIAATYHLALEEKQHQGEQAMALAKNAFSHILHNHNHD